MMRPKGRAARAKPLVLALSAVVFVLGLGVYRALHPKVYRVGVLLCPFTRNYFDRLKTQLDAAHPGRYQYTVYESMEEDGLRQYARRLLGEKPDLVVTTCFKSSGAMAEVAKGTQQPMLFLSNVGRDVVAANLTSPTGNITGITTAQEDAIEAGLQALKEWLPSFKRVGVLVNPNSPVMRGEFGDQTAFPRLAKRLGIQIDVLKATDFDEARRVLARDARHGRYDALFASAPSGPMGQILLEHALREKIPTFSAEPDLVRAGILIGSRPEANKKFWAKQVQMVEQLVQGVRADRIPVQIPGRYLLSINKETAKRLGLVIPDSLKSRAENLF